MTNLFNYLCNHSNPNDKKGNRCPLCHSNLGSGEEVWKDHLMSPNGCQKNSRKFFSSNSVPDQQNTTNTNNKSNRIQMQKK